MLIFKGAERRASRRFRPADLDASRQHPAIVYPVLIITAHPTQRDMLLTSAQESLGVGQTALPCSAALAETMI